MYCTASGIYGIFHDSPHLLDVNAGNCLCGKHAIWERFPRASHDGVVCGLGLWMEKNGKLGYVWLLFSSLEAQQTRYTYVYIHRLITDYKQWDTVVILQRFVWILFWNVLNHTVHMGMFDLPNTIQQMDWHGWTVASGCPFPKTTSL